MLEKIHYIYGLCDPDSGDLKYIGKSIEPQQRLWRHYQECKPERHKRAQWINRILADDKRPLLKILDQADEENINDLEIFYISYMRSLGCKLVNMTDGGDGVTMTTEIRAKISEANKNRPYKKRGPMAQETKDRIGRANRGRPQHPNASQLGNSWSPERRELLTQKRTARRKPIRLTNIETGQQLEFQTHREAANSLGLDRGNMTKVLKGKYAQTRGWKVEYV